MGPLPPPLSVGICVSPGEGMFSLSISLSHTPVWSAVTDGIASMADKNNAAPNSVGGVAEKNITLSPTDVVVVITPAASAATRQTPVYKIVT